MKFTILVCAFIVMASLCLQANGEFVVLQPARCEDGKPDGADAGKCVKVECSSDGQRTIKGCPEAQILCPEGKKVEEKMDMTKPFPECCPQLTCV